MKDSELYTLAEPELFDQSGDGEYIYISKEEFKKEKALSIQATVDVDDDLKIFEQRKHEESISFESFMKTLEEL